MPFNPLQDFNFSESKRHQNRPSITKSDLNISLTHVFEAPDSSWLEDDYYEDFDDCDIGSNASSDDAQLSCPSKKLAKPVVKRMIMGVKKGYKLEGDRPVIRFSDFTTRQKTVLKTQPQNMLISVILDKVTSFFTNPIEENIVVLGVIDKILSHNLATEHGD